MDAEDQRHRLPALQRQPDGNVVVPKATGAIASRQSGQFDAKDVLAAHQSVAVAGKAPAVERRKRVGHGILGRDPRGLRAEVAPNERAASDRASPEIGSMASGASCWTATHPAHRTQHPNLRNRPADADASLFAGSRGSQGRMIPTQDGGFPSRVQ